MTFCDALAMIWFEDVYNENDNDIKILCRKNVYKYFKKYLEYHAKGKLEPYHTYASLKAITDLFEFDYKKDKLKEKLGINYSYNAWSLSNTESNKKNKIYFIMIQMNKDKATDVYKVIQECFDDIIINLFRSYKGLLIAFDDERKKNHFLGYIKKEK